MVLDVSNGFLSPGSALPFMEKTALPTQDVMGETIAFHEIVLQGTYMVLEDAVHLKGILKTKACRVCARCLRTADVPLDVPFKEVFRKDVDEWEDEVFRYEGKAISLDQMALTLVMLNLPMSFVCKEDCVGNEEMRVWQEDVANRSFEDEQPAQRTFEALRSLLLKVDKEEV